MACFEEILPTCLPGCRGFDIDALDFWLILEIVVSDDDLLLFLIVRFGFSELLILESSSLSLVIGIVFCVLSADFALVLGVFTATVTVIDFDASESSFVLAARPKHKR